MTKKYKIDKEEIIKTSKKYIYYKIIKRKEKHFKNEKDSTSTENRKILSSLSKVYFGDLNFRIYCNYRGRISFSVYKDYEKLSRSKLGEGE